MRSNILSKLIFASFAWYSDRAYYGLCVLIKDIGRRLYTYMSLSGTLTLFSTCCFLRFCLQYAIHMVNNRTAFHAWLFRLLRDDHIYMPCAVGLYADMYIELWDRSSYVLHNVHASERVIQPAVICAHPSFVHLMCMFSLMVSLPILCDDTFVIMNESIV